MEEPLTSICSGFTEMSKAFAKLSDVVSKQAVDFALLGDTIHNSSGTTPTSLVKEKHPELKHDYRRSSISDTNKVITLNIGGTVFKTTQQTLISEKDSFFTSLLDYNDKKLPIPTSSSAASLTSSVASIVHIPETGNLFIDRDPTAFKFILDYLRNGQVFDADLYSSLPDWEQRMIKRDADFYQVGSLSNFLPQGWKPRPIHWDGQAAVSGGWAVYCLNKTAIKFLGRKDFSIPPIAICTPQDGKPLDHFNVTILDRSRTDSLHFGYSHSSCSEVLIQGVRVSLGEQRHVFTGSTDAESSRFSISFHFTPKTHSLRMVYHLDTVDKHWEMTVTVPKPTIPVPREQGPVLRFLSNTTATAIITELNENQKY